MMTECARRGCSNEGTNLLDIYSPKPHPPAYWCDKHYPEYLEDKARVQERAARERTPSRS